MIITLKNGENIDLEWNFLVLEYLEEYTNEDGTGLTHLKKDINSKKNQMKIHNHFLYSIIRANYDKPLTYKQALSLVSIKDSQKIGKFIQKNMNELDEFKKKEVRFTPGQKKKKK